ncbi:hypothetical protein D3C81_1344080 [compost metagenome]
MVTAKPVQKWEASHLNDILYGISYIWDSVLLKHRQLTRKLSTFIRPDRSTIYVDFSGLDFLYT